MKKVSLAIVGVTGMVGRAFLEVLEEKDLQIENFYVFASKRSAGQKIMFKSKQYTIEELKEDSFDRGIDIALFSAGSDISAKFAKIASSKGCIVIDNSSYFRMEKDVPLVVPEVNSIDIKNHRGIIANPNCSTIQAVVSLKPLHDKYKIKRIVYSTYQAVSGAGRAGVLDLENGLDGENPKTFTHQIANNCIPHIDVFMDNGYTKEEIKMIEETKKILHNDDIKITATAVRVPVINSHSESINVEFYEKFELSELIDVLRNSKGIKLLNDHTKNEYPLATIANGSDDVYIGRIRRDLSIENGINMFVVADNIRKGAATNAVQIAECIIKGEWN